MKTVLRIINRESSYFDLPNPYNMVPSKGDNVTFDGIMYVVSYLEFDYDNNTVYIVCLK